MSTVSAATSSGIPIEMALLGNAKSAMFAAIEIHNKPIFPYRYEVCTLLVVNAWELALKAYIAKKVKSVRLINMDVIVLGLLKASVLFFTEFIEQHFGEKLHEEANLILLPIGFTKPASPLD